jgi:phosphatidylinositol kinase/protein kinase (PI-3  family)
LIRPDAKIRQIVLANLSERFDKHLAQAENVRSLFIALNDEVFENRVTAVGLIGLLAKHNPAYVMPSLRKALIQLLTELEYSTVMYVPLPTPASLSLRNFCSQQAQSRGMHSVADTTRQRHTAPHQALRTTNASGSSPES